MDWRILDIRIGRANRAQYLTFLLCFIFIQFLFRMVETPIFVELPIIIVSLYLLILFSLRRVHDLGFGTAELTGTTTPDDPMATLKLTHPKPRINFLLFFWVCFVEGDRLRNDYGYPPCGLNFRSMVATDYSEKQKDEAAKAEKTQYKSERKKHAVEPVEFKEREIK